MKTFNYRELATATNNFRSESLIGEGGFGPVYKGQIENTDLVVSLSDDFLVFPCTILHQRKPQSPTHYSLNIP